MRQYHAFSVATNIEFYGDLNPMSLYDGAFETLEEARTAAEVAWMDSAAWATLQATIAHLEDDGSLRAIEHGSCRENRVWVWTVI